MGLDLRDKKLLSALARNCRLSHITLSRAIGISKDAVAYRIKRLEQRSWIQQRVLFIDARKLGFTRYHILVRFKSAEESKDTLAKLVSAHPFLMWVNTFIGRWDLQLIVDAKDGFHLNQIREELFQLLDNQVAEYTILTHMYDFEFTLLNPEIDLPVQMETRNDFSFSKLTNAKNFPVDKEFKQHKLKKSDIFLLNELSKNPSASLTELSQQHDRQTVKERITKLIEDKIILSFSAVPNNTKQGFVVYYLLIRLKQDTPDEVLKNPFTELSNIFYSGKMVGDYDMIAYFNARNPKELNESIDILKKHIGKYIIRYDLLINDKVQHWKQFSKGVHDSLLKMQE